MLINNGICAACVCDLSWQSVACDYATDYYFC